MTQLTHIITSVHAFTSADESIDFMTDIDDQCIILITSETFARQSIAVIPAIPCLDSIYITTITTTSEIAQWIHRWPKIKRVYPDVKATYEDLRAAAKQCNHNAIEFSFAFSVDDVINTHVVQTDKNRRLTVTAIS